MNIVVFGASGKVGRLVVETALAQEHQVRAFVRSQNPFSTEANPEILRGDIADTTAVTEAIQGMDGVISTLGGWGKGGVGVLQTGMQVVVPAMHRASITRIVTLTGAGVRWADDEASLRLRVNRVILGLMERAALADGEAHLAQLAASPLDWTTVRAPGIRPSGSNLYRLDARVPSLMTTVPGPAVARCLVDLVAGSTYLRQAPGIHRG